MGKERVECSVEEVELTNDHGRKIEGVRLKCEECGWETESFGTGPKSIRRCLALMREECPNDEGDEHYYHAEGADD